MALKYKEALSEGLPGATLPQPGPPGVERGTMVANLIAAFDQVGRADAPLGTIAGVMAVAVLELRRRSQAQDSVRLRARHKDELLRKLQSAYHRLWWQVDPVSQTELTVCFRACGALVLLWAASDSRRAARGEHVDDANDLALVLQTSMLNIALTEAVGDRIAQRDRGRAETLKSLIEPSTAGGAS